MREHPIIFGGPMVRAILAGQKSQTRRIVKPQPFAGHYLQPMWGTSPDGASFGDMGLWREVGPDYPDGDSDDRRCPYGQQGDRLWVREAWTPADRLVDGYEREEPTVIAYRADLSVMRWEGGPGVSPQEQKEYGWDDLQDSRWRPSIHMPRWASRLTLEMTGVRVERLQDITREDGTAEGVPQTAGEAHQLGLIDMTKVPGHEYDNRTTRENYARLWDSINGKRVPWESNPWVWCIEFKVAA